MLVATEALELDPTGMGAKAAAEPAATRAIKDDKTFMVTTSFGALEFVFN